MKCSFLFQLCVYLSLIFFVVLSLGFQFANVLTKVCVLSKLIFFFCHFHSIVVWWKNIIPRKNFLSLFCFKVLLVFANSKIKKFFFRMRRVKKILFFFLLFFVFTKKFLFYETQENTENQCKYFVKEKKKKFPDIYFAKKKISFFFLMNLNETLPNDSEKIMNKQKKQNSTISHMKTIS